MTTVAEVCKTHNLNPKIIRAKLRRAIENNKLAIERDKGGTWVASPAVMKFLGLDAKPAAKSTKSKSTKSKKTATAEATA